LLGALCIVLAIAVIGLAWYAYPQFKRQDASLQELRDQMRDRIQQVEQKASSTSSEENSLRGDAAKLGRDLRARIDAIGSRARQAADDAYNRLEARLDAEIKSRTDGVTNLTERVMNLESSRAADQTQIAQLNQQLNQVRTEADQRAVEEAQRQANELDQMRHAIEENQTGAEQRIAELQQDAERNRRDVAGISNKLAVEKIPFEAGTNHTSEVADGITLHVSGTDPAYRRVSGWMWVASEHRDIWLRAQEALEPVIFYGSQDGQKRELVITNVAKNSVTGYLLLPKQTSEPALSRDSGGE
jgi:hypothetical protein